MDDGILTKTRLRIRIKETAAETTEEVWTQTHTKIIGRKILPAAQNYYPLGSCNGVRIANWMIYNFPTSQNVALLYHFYAPGHERFLCVSLRSARGMDRFEIS